MNSFFMAMRSRGADVAIPALAIIALIAIAATWSHSGFVIAGGDSIPPIDSWSMLSGMYGGWSHVSSYIGDLAGSNGSVPYLLVSGLLDALVGDSLGQAMFMGLLLCVGWGGAYALSRVVGARPIVSAVAATAYVLNPFVQVSIELTSFMWCHALMPWLVTLSYVAMYRPEWRTRVLALLAILWVLPVSELALTPQLLFEMVLTLAMFVAVFCWAKRPDRAFGVWAARAVALVTLVSAWWTVPTAMSLFGAQIGHTTDAGSFAWAFRRSSLLNNLQFNYGWGWPWDLGYFPFSRWYDSNIVTYTSGFILALAAGFALLCKRTRLVRGLIAIALLMIFLSKGPHEPLGALTTAMYRLPGFFLFQEAAGGTSAAILAFSVALSIGLQRFNRDTKPAWVRIATPSTIAAACVASAFAMLSGQTFHGATAVGPSTYVRVPSYWQSVANYVNLRCTSSGTGVLVLPEDTFYSIRYTFGLEGADQLPGYLFHCPTMTLAAGSLGGYTTQAKSVQIMSRVDRLMVSGSPLAKKVLAELGIGTVIYRGDAVNYAGPSAEARPALRDVQRMLGDNATAFGPIRIFALKQTAPELTAYPTVIAGNYGGFDAGDMAVLSSLNESVPRVDVRSLLAANPNFNPLILENGNGTDLPIGSTYLEWLRDVPLRSAYTGANLNARSLIRDGQFRASLVATRVPEDLGLTALSTSWHLKPGEAQIGLINEAPTSYSLTDGLPVAYTATVSNPSRRTISADVRIQMYERAGASYWASDQRGVVLPTTRNIDGMTNSLTELVFHDIEIPPGISDLAFQSTAGVGPAKSIFVPPILPNTADGKIEFVKSGLKQNDANELNDFVNMGAAPINLPVAPGTYISFTQDFPPTVVDALGVRIGSVLNGKPKLCLVRFSYKIDVADALESCGLTQEYRSGNPTLYITGVELQLNSQALSTTQLASLPQLLRERRAFSLVYPTFRREEHEPVYGKVVDEGGKVTSRVIGRTQILSLVPTETTEFKRRLDAALGPALPSAGRESVANYQARLLWGSVKFQVSREHATLPVAAVAKISYAVPKGSTLEINVDAKGLGAIGFAETCSAAPMDLTEEWERSKGSLRWRATGGRACLNVAFLQRHADNFAAQAIITAKSLLPDHSSLLKYGGAIYSARGSRADAAHLLLMNRALVDVATVGAPPKNQRPVNIGSNFNSLGIIFADAKPGALILRERYHWTWIAISAQGLLGHVEVNGWENGWLPERAGRVVILNLLSLFVDVMGVAGLLTTAMLVLRALLWSRLRRRRASAYEVVEPT